MGIPLYLLEFAFGDTVPFGPWRIATADFKLYSA